LRRVQEGKRIDVRKDRGHARLKEAAEEVEDQALLEPADRNNLPYITADAAGPKH